MAKSGTSSGKVKRSSGSRAPRTGGPRISSPNAAVVTMARNNQHRYPGA